MVDTSPLVADEVKTTTCYMCACRCGIRVHLKDGRIRYIDGNPNHPVNHGVICGKGSAGIMNHYSPARLRKPLLRTGERGSGDFKEIEWGEALALATEWLGAIRASEPRKLALFTGRDQSQSFTGWWAKQFGTPNFAAHGGFCSVNMAAGGLYTVGGSFWEFGDPDWDRTKYLLMFGVAEDHDSNPIKTGIAKLKRAARSSSRSIRSRPATPPSPTNGSAFIPAPMACSCCRWCTNCWRRTASIWIFSRATRMRRGWCGAILAARTMGCSCAMPMASRCRMSARWAR